MGQEDTPEEYVAAMVQVGRELHRILRDDGVWWLVLGDSWDEKNLRGIPWRTALALQADGWWLRDEIIWSKSAVMPSSVTDRCTRSHEQVFMLSKNARYFYDNTAIWEPLDSPPEMYLKRGEWNRQHQAGQSVQGSAVTESSFASVPLGRNKRSVWTIAPSSYHGAHYATFPDQLVTLCIRASTRMGDCVLDPFAGSGTTAVVAERLGRRWILTDLSYQALQKERLGGLQRRLFA